MTTPSWRVVSGDTAVYASTRDGNRDTLLRRVLLKAAREADEAHAQPRSLRLQPHWRHASNLWDCSGRPTKVATPLLLSAVLRAASPASVPGSAAAGGGHSTPPSARRRAQFNGDIQHQGHPVASPGGAASTSAQVARAAHLLDAAASRSFIGPTDAQGAWPARQDHQLDSRRDAATASAAAGDVIGVDYYSYGSTTHIVDLREDTARIVPIDISTDISLSTGSFFFEAASAREARAAPLSGGCLFAPYRQPTAPPAGASSELPLRGQRASSGCGLPLQLSPIQEDWQAEWQHQHQAQPQPQRPGAGLAPMVMQQANIDTCTDAARSSLTAQHRALMAQLATASSKEVIGDQGARMSAGEPYPRSSVGSSTGSSNPCMTASATACSSTTSASNGVELEGWVSPRPLHSVTVPVRAVVWRGRVHSISSPAVIIAADYIASSGGGGGSCPVPASTPSLRNLLPRAPVPAAEVAGMFTAAKARLRTYLQRHQRQVTQGSGAATGVDRAPEAAVPVAAVQGGSC